MRVTTRMTVPKEAQVTITLHVSVEELERLLELTKEEGRWPMVSLRQAFRESISKASDAYFSDHVVG